jgi:AraC-like DNA-binding protein
MARDVHLSGGVTVKSRLDRVRDWPALAKAAKYQLKALARICKVSERQLQRYLWERFQKAPKHLLDAWRAKVARQDLVRGELVKAASNSVCFSSSSNFTRFYKRVTGITPHNQI